jgi:hypothetical protein
MTAPGPSDPDQIPSAPDSASSMAGAGRPGPTGGEGSLTSPEAILSACAAEVAREAATPTGSRLMQATVAVADLTSQAARDELRAAAVAVIAADPRLD